MQISGPVVAGVLRALLMAKCSNTLHATRNLRNIIILLFLLCFSCGGESLQFDVTIPSQTEPYIHRVDPSNGQPGDTVIVYGFGFSIITSNNIVSFGDTSITASAYSLLADPSDGEIELLTIEVPSGVSVGSSAIYITVFENTSNADISFTINP